VIITRTPYRVSFFGGGTDYPAHFEKHGGAVLGTAIDKFTYISVTPFYSKLFDYSIRIAYRKVECVKNLDEIEHAPFRECLRWCGITKDIEVNYTSEVPSFSGLGSSSSFIVGLQNALMAFQGRSAHPLRLAYQAIAFEHQVLREAVGCQDQTFAAVGGFNLLEFRKCDDIVVHRLPLSPARLQEFEKHLLLIHTGIRRKAAEIASTQIKKAASNKDRLVRMREMVDEGYSILTGGGGLAAFGSLLDEGWRLKRQLDRAVSNDIIDYIYQEGCEAGALGGKLLGAGGGGFVLLFVPPEKRQKVCDRLKDFQAVTIHVNAAGSTLLHAPVNDWHTEQAAA
jgi:D-glycero-alpha-D-manno-heptose-7-phosphate kinase